MRKQVQNYEARQAAAAYVRQALAGKTKEEAYQVLQSLSVDTLRRALSVFGLFARDCKSEMVNAIFATSSKVPVFHRRANSSASPPLLPRMPSGVSLCAQSILFR